jgi:DNA-binding MarR family transcriptional regulator
MSNLSLAAFADKVGELMPVIAREFIRHQSKDFYKTKITPPQFIVLDILGKHEECKMSELARFINVTTAAMTGIVDRLVRDGYIARINDPKDRRIVKVKLTPKGRNAVDKMSEQRKKIAMKLFERISEKEREDYLGILTHISEQIVEPQKGR